MKIFVWKYSNEEKNDIFFSIEKNSLKSFIDDLNDLSSFGEAIQLKITTLPENSPHYIDDENSILPGIWDCFEFLEVKILDQSEDLKINYNSKHILLSLSNAGLSKFIENLKSANYKGSFVRFNTMNFNTKDNSKGKLRILSTLNDKPIFM